MPLIGLAGETFRRHAGVFGTRRGLQDVKSLNRIACWISTVRRFVRSSLISLTRTSLAPEIIHILLLRREKLLESLIDYAIHGPLGTTTEFFRPSGRRSVIDHKFAEVDRTAGLGFD
jgi:hypothetical protein